jgi:hypothetical protein
VNPPYAQLICTSVAARAVAPARNKHWLEDERSAYTSALSSLYFYIFSTPAPDQRTTTTLSARLGCTFLNLFQISGRKVFPNDEQKYCQLSEDQNVKLAYIRKETRSVLSNSISGSFGQHGRDDFLVHSHAHV